MSKKILVTGGSGFIGTNLVSELRSRGYEVVACDLLNHELPQYIRCDVGKYRHIERVFDRYGPFDYVYHLAAEYGRWNGEDHYENLWHTNVIGTKHMLRMQEQQKFRMIFFSSAEVYGDYEGEMTEDVMIHNPIWDTYQMNDYAISKWAGELMCYALHDKPYTVYEGHKRIIDYVEDTCKTFANIVENFIPGEVYNIGGKREWEHDIKEYSDMVLSACGKDDSLVTYKKAEAHTTKVKHMDFTKAEHDLNHDPQIPPEEGIKKTVEWMKWYYRLKENESVIMNMSRL